MDFLTWFHTPANYEPWFTVQKGFSCGPTKVWEANKMWDADPVMTPYRNAAALGRRADDLLRPAFAVHLRGVDETNAEVETEKIEEAVEIKAQAAVFLNYEREMAQREVALWRFALERNEDFFRAVYDALASRLGRTS